MKALTFYVLAIPAILAAVLSAPGCESKTQVANTVPGDLVLSASKCFIEEGGTVTLSGTAADDDGDPLTFHWTATAGSFSPESGIGASVQWTAPGTPGYATIAMAVTDEIATVTKTQGITICTELPSSITASTTLPNTGINNSGSVYIVTNSDLLRIASTATLTIEPGVTIVFDGASGGIEAFGRIVANGTPLKKIRFRGNTCGSSSGLWDGIYLNGQLGHYSEAVFRNVQVSQSSNGIQVFDGGQLTLDSCSVYDNTNIGISVVHQMSGAHIFASDIWDNGIGIEIDNADVEIASSSVQYNTSNGLEISYSLEETDVTIDSTIVANNGYNGITLSSQAAPAIRYCSIYSNGPEAGGGYALQLAGYGGTDTLHAENNFWGAGNTTAQKISLVIFDGADQYGLAVVDFTPWLSESPGPMNAELVEAAKERQWEKSSR